MKNGFTLIELIIAIFILSIGIVGIFGAYSAMVVATSDISNRFTATYLAQEGIEIVKNIRDLNWANINNCSGQNCNYSWVDGLTTTAVNHPIDCSVATGTGCEANYATNGDTTLITTWPTISQYNSLPGNYLYTNKDSGFYDYLISGILTKFKRKIIISPKRL